MFHANAAHQNWPHLSLSELVALDARAFPEQCRLFASGPGIAYPMLGKRYRMRRGHFRSGQFPQPEPSGSDRSATKPVRETPQARHESPVDQVLKHKRLRRALGCRAPSTTLCQGARNPDRHRRDPRRFVPQSFQNCLRRTCIDIPDPIQHCHDASGAITRIAELTLSKTHEFV